MRLHYSIALLTAFSGFAQESAIDSKRPEASVFIRPYLGAYTPPIRLRNSSRLDGLIRANRLYLTVQDAIALAIENNLDLEVDRYGPLVQDWQVERAQGGGPLRGVTAGNSQVGQTPNGQGVVGSEKSAGLAGSSGNGGGGSNTGATISQIGTVTQNLDPVLTNTSLWSHTTSPQPNAAASQTVSLVDDQRIYNTQGQLGLLTGGYARAAFNESYLNENAPSDILNPSVAPQFRLYLQHSLLQGFGVNMNSRFIHIAEKNAVAARSTFRSQLLNIVAGVLNQYWDLVTALEDLKARQSALDLARKSFEDTQTEIKAGALSRVDIYLAQGEFAARKRELVQAQTLVRQQETQLKNSLSRNGLEDARLEAAEVIPLDSIAVPETDNLPPLRDLVARAIAQRPDLAVTRINEETAAMSLLGTENALLPTAIGFIGTYDSGLAGQSNVSRSGLPPDPFFVGGLGAATAQIFRRNFPSTYGGAYMSVPIHNRQAQADYQIDQLQMLQSQLIDRRDLNQLVVTISSQTFALRQARTRYSTAVETRKLQEQLLDKEKLNFSLGGSTLNDLIAAERSLFASQSSEIAALAAYSHARIALDQVLGDTLEVNHVSVDEAMAGKVAKLSKLPDQAPQDGVH